MVSAILVLIFLTGPLVGVQAKERHPLLEQLDRMPPLPEAEREAFDRAALSMWDANCQCLTFLHKGVVRAFRLPLDDTARRLLIDGIKEGYVVPLEKQGAPY